jgi:hypothetical protein
VLYETHFCVENGNYREGSPEDYIPSIFVINNPISLTIHNEFTEFDTKVSTHTYKNLYEVASIPTKGKYGTS